MVGRIARKELLETLRDGRFRLLAAVVIVLSVTSLAAGWTVVLPAVLNLLATTVYPVPSRVEMIQAMRMASDDAAAEGSALLAKYYEDHPELTGGGEQAVNEANMLRVATNARIEQQVAPVIQQFERQLQGQQRMIDGFRLLSPSLLMQDALNEISGTGAMRHREFLAQVTRYHQVWRAYFVPLIFQKVRLTDYADVPRFTFREEPLGAPVSRVLVALAGICAPSFLIALLGVRALRRYPVTA
jgi:ABC-2 type transport system permease protein